MDQETRKSNFLIFMTDQQLGTTQQSGGPAYMPNLERLKRHGVTFQEAYCPSPHCCPSRASFFSGLYPSEHGIWNNIDLADAFSHGLNEGIRLFSEDLKEAGYQMYFSGKWHVSAEEGPGDRGFGPWIYPPQEGRYKQWKKTPFMGDWDWLLEDDYITEVRGRGDGEISRVGFPPYTQYGVKENPFGDGDVVSCAEDWLEKVSEEEPFCMYVGTLGPHDPYFVPEEYLDLYPDESMELPVSWTDRMLDKPNLYRRTRERFDQLDETEQKRSLKHYLAFCSYEDALFGRLLDVLERRNLLENTVVLYVSDHGDYAGAHGLWTKGLPCFKEAYHICSVMGYGGIKAEGAVIGHRVSLLDYAPTFLDLAGILKADVTAGRQRFSGYSLKPFLEGRIPENWREETYTQSNGNECYGIQRSIFTDEYHLVFNGFDYDELYDLRKDPDCMKNVIEEQQYETVIYDLYRKLWRFAYLHRDALGDPYITTALARYGPGIIRGVKRE